jgi:hypothetical protein
MANSIPLYLRPASVRRASSSIGLLSSTAKALSNLVDSARCCVAVNMASERFRDGVRSLIAGLSGCPREESGTRQNRLASPSAEKFRTPAYPKRHVRRPATGAREWFDAFREDSTLEDLRIRPLRPAAFPKRHVRRPAFGAQEWYDLLCSEFDTSESETEKEEQREHADQHTPGLSLRNRELIEQVQLSPQERQTCRRCRNALPEDEHASLSPQAIEVTGFPCNTKAEQSSLIALSEEKADTCFTNGDHTIHGTVENHRSYQPSHQTERVTQIYAPSERSCSALYCQERFLSRFSPSTSDGSIDLPLHGLPVSGQCPVLHIRIPSSRMSNCEPREDDRAGSSILARRNVVLPRLKYVSSSDIRNAAL